MVNEGGFIHEYMKDYLSQEYPDETKKNYEVNLNRILEITDYIYAYYESIRKDCNGHFVLDSNVKTVNVQGTGEVDFDQYIGGVILAEFNSGNEEATKAFAIMVRSYTLGEIGLDGSKSIENSSNRQNYNPSYSPAAYPDIAKAVEETKGLIITDYLSADVKKTEYDAFCPTTSELIDGFYYLDDEQGNLPISPSAYHSKTGNGLINEDSRYLACPCFQNAKSRPHEKVGSDNVGYSPFADRMPTCKGGEPSQETPGNDKAVCWKRREDLDTEKDYFGMSCFANEVFTVLGQNSFIYDKPAYAWEYKPSGGHGRGASQIALKYFSELGYDQDALIRLFYRYSNTGGGLYDKAGGNSTANIKLVSGGITEAKCQNTPYYGSGFRIIDSN